MFLIRRSDEMIVGNLRSRRKIFEDFSAFVAERFRFYASFYRSLLYLLHAMLISSGTKYCLLALEDLPSLEDVREDHCV